MEALINMICDLEITSRSEKNCVKISWWSDIPLKSYQRKTVLRGHEIHSSNFTHAMLQQLQRVHFWNQRHYAALSLWLLSIYWLLNSWAKAPKWRLPRLSITPMPNGCECQLRPRNSFANTTAVHTAQAMEVLKKLLGRSCPKPPTLFYHRPSKWCQHTSNLFTSHRWDDEWRTSSFSNFKGII